MICIFCGADTSVTNSRPQKRLNQVWRRRQCQSCGAIFSTHEAASLNDSWRVRLADGTLVAFERDKLFMSIYKSCEHRSDNINDASALTATIISRLFKKSWVTDGLVKPAAIINMSLEVLNNFDTAAAVHYQAFHPVR